MSKKFLKSAFFIVISVFIISCKTLPHENFKKAFLSENEELQWQKISEDFSIIDMRNPKNAETFLEFFSVKNISKERLNISADELMERFVRGDSSRNTEGSGLGLSIAQSLTEILGGKLEISIDGDLFKAIVKIENRENQENHD